jgi:hypothetical protein
MQDRGRDRTRARTNVWQRKQIISDIHDTPALGSSRGGRDPATPSYQQRQLQVGASGGTEGGER